MTNNSHSDYYRRNNLGISSSPYLLQHADNPVWWQEWREDVLAHALSENKPVFVSVGYSTCHWCHVMAAEAFSDYETTLYLNENFICIKIDREQRPDIDQFLMHFIQSQSGNGGWPLNVFLTPGLTPVVAITYAPLKSKGNMLSFLEIARRVKDYMESNANDIPDFVYTEQEPPMTDPDNLLSELGSYYDHDFAGFGYGQKFPPHSTLLYLLYSLPVRDNDEIRKLCSGTLNMIQMRGLNDYLQGGIFRYCVDRKWTIPHFEKMLYDQALSLWTYSLAYRVLGNNDYRIMAEKIIRCLEECFENDGLYYSAFNADTDHKEGATYLWRFDEIQNLLEPEEFKTFLEVYQVSREGNFEGMNHLIRRNNNPLPEIENKLLAVRKKRNQPSRDEKILCGINALTAIALIQAGRFLNKPRLEEKASGTVRRLLEMFRDDQSLGHSYFNGSLQKQSFLSDTGALLTAVTMLYEKDEEWLDTMTALADYTASFKEGGTWIESKPADFQKIPASWNDQPVPSGASLAEMGLLLYSILTGKEYHPLDYRRAAQSDFYNINALISNGLFHVYTSRNLIPWESIPANSIQKRGEPETDCYNGVCRPFKYQGMVIDQ